MEREGRIRRRAYNIWCAEGWPKGRDQEHWEQARKEIELETRLTAYREHPPVSVPANVQQQS